LVDVEEGGGVAVVSEPACACGHVLFGFEVFFEDCEFVLFEFGFDAEVFLPAFGDGLGDEVVPGVFVEGDLDDEVIGEVGVFEELLGVGDDGVALGLVFGIADVWEPGGGGVVSDGAGGDEGRGGGLAEPTDFVGDGSFIDAEGEGASDAGIGEGIDLAIGECGVAVEVVEVCAEGRDGVGVGAGIVWEEAVDGELVEPLGAVLGDLLGVFVEEGLLLGDHIASVGGGDVGDPVDSSGLVGEDPGVWIGDRGDVDRVDGDVVFVPEELVFLEAHVSFHAPSGEDEWAVGYEGAGLSPAGLAEQAGGGWVWAFVGCDEGFVDG